MTNPIPNWKAPLARARSAMMATDRVSHQRAACLIAQGERDQITVEGMSALYRAISTDPTGELRDRLLTAARAARGRTFGAKVATLAPIKLADFCDDEAGTCDSDSLQPVRNLRTPAQRMMEQARQMMDRGICDFEVDLTGASAEARQAAPDLVRSLRRTMLARGVRGTVGLRGVVTTTQGYTSWAALGVDNMFVDMGTYHPSSYARATAANRGVNSMSAADEWTFRANAQHRAIAAGLSVGIGFRLDLSPSTLFELAMAHQHISRLLCHSSRTSMPIVIRVPRARSASDVTCLDGGDMGVVLAALLFLALPKGRVWLMAADDAGLNSRVDVAEIAGPLSFARPQTGALLGAMMQRVNDARASGTAELEGLRRRGLHPTSARALIAPRTRRPDRRRDISLAS